MSLVLSNLQLIPELQDTPREINEDTTRRIREETVQLLRQRNTLLASTVEVRVARQATKNFINLRVRRQFQSMLTHVQNGEIVYCFMASDKFDSTVVLIALSTVSQADPRCLQLPRSHIPKLKDIVQSFLDKFRVQPHGFTYTVERERKDRTLSHSRHFHLKLHFDPAVYCQLLPVMSLHNTAMLDELDPIAYSRSRPIDQWETVYEKMLSDHGGLGPWTSPPVTNGPQNDHDPQEWCGKKAVKPAGFEAECEADKKAT